MKNKTNRNLIIGSSLTLVLILVIWSPVQSQLAEPIESKTMVGAPIMECCQGMKAQKQIVYEEMKAQDTELTEQVAKMNSAPADKKMDLMAAVITRMVEQRMTMGARKEKIQEEMMQHMKQHIPMGQDFMSLRPMMIGMGDMEMKPIGPHKEHSGHPK
ncbi:hypothetical protein ACFL6U_29820 [Planctomycetota bacterium]